MSIKDSRIFEYSKKDLTEAFMKIPVLKGMEAFSTTEKDIIENKKIGRIYVADFPKETGKYISVSEYEDYTGQDLDLKISSKINLRITYITNEDKITGVEISKLFNGKLEKINLTTLSFDRIMQLLYVFSTLDLKSVANKSLILDKSIVGDSDQLMNFLELVVKDPIGRERISEVVKNYALIKKGDIDDLVDRKSAVELFEKILNSESEFNTYKLQIGAKKNEQIWENFFKKNDWILGSEYVEILEQRNIDEDDITDYLLKSFDGFVDIIELKLHTAPFWTTEMNPTADLTSATMQCIKYIFEIEKKLDSIEYKKKLQKASLVKPKITLIYGRSNNWSPAQREMYRILNSSYNNISILTYDYVLERAKRIAGIELIN